MPRATLRSFTDLSADDFVIVKRRPDPDELCAAFEAYERRQGRRNASLQVETFHPFEPCELGLRSDWRFDQGALFVEVDGAICCTLELSDKWKVFGTFNDQSQGIDILTLYETAIPPESLRQLRRARERDREATARGLEFSIHRVLEREVADIRNGRDATAWGLYLFDLDPYLWRWNRPPVRLTDVLPRAFGSPPHDPSAPWRWWDMPL